MSHRPMHRARRGGEAFSLHFERVIAKVFRDDKPWCFCQRRAGLSVGIGGVLVVTAKW